MLICVDWVPPDFTASRSWPFSSGRDHRPIRPLGDRTDGTGYSPNKGSPHRPDPALTQHAPASSLPDAGRVGGGFRRAGGRRDPGHLPTDDVPDEAAQLPGHGHVRLLICFDLSRWLTGISLHSPCKSLLLARWICGREARECGRARWATRVQRVVRGLSTRPEGRAPVRRTRPHTHRAVGRLASAGGVLSQDKAGLIATVDHADMRGLGTTGLHCVAELAFL